MICYQNASSFIKNSYYILFLVGFLHVCVSKKNIVEKLK